jgi:adenine phosphoribosyltransferase
MSTKRRTTGRVTTSTKRRPVTKRALGPASKPARRAPPLALPVTVRPQSTFDFCRLLIRDVPDFPKPGIVFKDITPLLASPRALHIVLDGIAERFIGEHIDAIVGIEARGFIFGGALAARLNASFVPVRKPGKLPAAVDRVEFATEYSREVLEMHRGSLREEARVVIVDDVLATGGTAKASAELVHAQGGYVIGYAFVVELGFLGGRERLLPVRVESCIRY